MENYFQWRRSVIMKVPLWNSVGGPGTPLLNFEGGPGVPLLNFRGPRVPLLNLEGGLRSQGPGPTFTPCQFTSHFLLHCPPFNYERYTLLSTLKNINCKLIELTKSSLSQTLLYGNTLLDKEKTRILNPTIEYILSTERFKESLVQ